MPGMTPSASVTMRTAWPVPPSRSCTTTDTSGTYLAASALTSSRAWPATTTTRCGSSSPAAASACPSMLRPHSECSTFGTRDFIRVPSPAARTITATGRGSLTRQVSSGITPASAVSGAFGWHRPVEPTEPALFRMLRVPGCDGECVYPPLIRRIPSGCHDRMAGFRNGRDKSFIPGSAPSLRPRPRRSAGLFPARLSNRRRLPIPSRLRRTLRTWRGWDELTGLDAAFPGHRGQLGAERLGRGAGRLARAGEQGGDGGDHVGRDRELERHPETVMERGGDQVREELAPGHVDGMPGGQVRQQLRAEQLLHRVVAEEGREQDADRRQVGDLERRGGRDALRGQAAEHGGRQLAGKP